MEEENLDDLISLVGETRPPRGASEFPDVTSQNSDNRAQHEFKNWSWYDEDMKRLKNKRYEQDTTQRNWLSGWAALLVSFWLVMVLFILAGNHISYKLNDSVLITLLGTTTLNVLGLMVIVLNDLFGKDKN